MSNSDHSINQEIADELKTSLSYAGYTACNFYGIVWYENNQYHCEIKRYRCHVDTISSADLIDIMNIASEQYGVD